MTSPPSEVHGEKTSLLIGLKPLGSSSQTALIPDTVTDNGDNGTPCFKHGNQFDTVDSVTLEKNNRAKRKLIIACVICLFFLIGEFLGGYFAGSLAIITDATHLLSDFASFLISLLAIWFATRPSSSKLSFGWHRAEVMGAIFSVLIIWVLTGILVYNAVMRIISGQHRVNAQIMLIVAACGVGVNIIMGLVLGHSHSHGHSHDHAHNESHDHSHNGPHDDAHNGSHDDAHSASDDDSRDDSHDHSHGKRKKKISLSPSVREQATDENVNVRAAFVHVLGDLVQSVGVLIAALIIWFKPNYSIADPICTFVFSVIVLITTITVLRDALLVLMEGTPQSVDINEIKERLGNIRGVKVVHDIHVWSLTVGTTALSAHLTIAHKSKAERILSEATTLVSVSYNIQHATIQIEPHDGNSDANGAGCQFPN